MGFLSGILGAAAPIVGGIFGGPVGSAIGGAVGGLIGGKNGGSVQSGTQTVTQQQQLDPRAQAYIYGDGTAANPGLLAQNMALGQQPQNAQNAAFGGAAQNFLGGQGSNILNQLQGGAGNLLNSAIEAPRSVTQGTPTPNAIGAAAVRAAQIDAPSQNSLDLKGAYNNFINGNAGANPYLTSALQSGVDQTNSAFQKNQTDLTNNLQRNVLGGIRSNSVLAGQYGGSRQGIAEGNAISDYTNQLTNANLQLGQANSANTIGAQAQAFNQGQDRSLSALQGLSGQQYGVAAQNAAFQQQANQQYAANQQDANKTNQAVQLNNGQFNASQQQQTNLANQSAQQSANALNSANQATGLGALSGLLGNAYGYAQNQDNYALNRAGQTNSLLAPYLSANSSSNTQTPVYSNPGGNILGGAAAGLGLYNQFANLGGGTGNNTGYNTFNVSPGTAPVNTSALQDLSWLNNIGR